MPSASIVSPFSSFSVGEKVDLDFVYKQEFVIKQVETAVIVTTPRPNEPATFIDTVTLSLQVGTHFTLIFR